LLLNAITSDDHRALFDIFSDVDVTRFNDVQTFASLEDAKWLEQFIQRRFRDEVGIRWAIRLKDAPRKLIGTVGFNAWMRHNHCGEIGYDLLRFYWGRGFMTEALQPVIAFGFSQLALNRIEADVMVGNHASAQVLAKLGFTEEGVLRQRGCWKGAFHDLRIFSLLREDIIKKGLTWVARYSTH
jgi:ribosomal-protein-alanine N-acetyltransferase